MNSERHLALMHALQSGVTMGGPRKPFPPIPGDLMIREIPDA